MDREPGGPAANARTSGAEETGSARTEGSAEPGGAVAAKAPRAAGQGIVTLPGWRLVLASGSPRRRELLRMIGMDFELRVPDVRETSQHESEPSRFVTELALAKAKSVSVGEEGALVLGADTVVVLDGRILGKPRDDAEAARMLRALSGRTHEVYTGVALVDAETGLAKTGFERSEVTMKRLTEEEVSRYVATREPCDKAGSYGIQGLGAVFIQYIKGCYFNVMGLPVAKFYQMANELSEELRGRRSKGGPGGD
ncbi:MAG: septum formation inhibitor Maf [Candidatus Eisenbacteria bacterium]|nr:septum formation inhibitor Maf [Candidatus Eisenbacteria bacterium]